MKMHYPKTEADWLKLRHGFVSSTESAALFGHSPYTTPFELAVMKKKPDPVQTLEQTERMTWGLRLQEAIAKGISEDYGVKVRRVRGYGQHDTARMGASFDYEVVGIAEDREVEIDPMLMQMYTDLGPGVLEIKNVDRYIFRQQWKLEDGLIEAPAHIEIQVQHQLECIRRNWAVMGVFIGGNETQLILRERDEVVGAAIASKVVDFWALLAAGKMPPVQLPADVDIIRTLYLMAAPGQVLDAQDLAKPENVVIAELCQKYRDAVDARDIHEQARKSTAAALLMKIGPAEKVLSPGHTIQANTVAECDIPATTRKSYRTLTVRAKKTAAA